MHDCNSVPQYIQDMGCCGVCITHHTTRCFLNIFSHKNYNILNSIEHNAVQAFSVYICSFHLKQHNIQVNDGYICHINWSQCKQNIAYKLYYILKLMSLGNK